MEETIEMLEQALAILQSRRKHETGLGAPVVLIKEALNNLIHSPYRFSEVYKGDLESYKKTLNKNVKDL